MAYLDTISVANVLDADFFSCTDVPFVHNDNPNAV
jgi:hypothetical protein